MDNAEQDPVDNAEPEPESVETSVPAEASATGESDVSTPSPNPSPPPEPESSRKNIPGEEREVRSVRLALRFENQGPRPVTVFILDSRNLECHVDPFVSKEIPVSFNASGGKAEDWTIRFVVSDGSVAKTNSVAVDSVDWTATATWIPEPSRASYRNILQTGENRQKILHVFKMLAKYLSDRKNEKGVRKILGAGNGFEIVEKLAESEAADDRYALLRWLHERMRNEGFGPPESVSDDEWNRVKKAWDDMKSQSSAETEESSAKDDKGDTDAIVIRKGNEGPDTSSIPAGWKEYKIKKGDNLTRIAKLRLPKDASEKDVNSLVAEICKVNGIPTEKRNGIRIGQTVFVPPPPSPKGAGGSSPAPTGGSEKGVLPD